MTANSTTYSTLQWICNQITRLSSAAATIYILVFVVWGASSGGYKYYYDVSKSTHFGSEDYKGWMPVHTLTIPLLIAATAANFLWVDVEEVGWIRYDLVKMPYFMRASCKRTSSYAARMLRCVQRSFNLHMDQYNVISFFIVFAPLSCYLYFDIARHMKPEVSTDKMVQEIAKAFGMVSMLSMSIFFLIPVTRHGIFIHSLPPEKTIRVHIWCGSIAIITAFIHGMMFIYGWAFLKYSDKSVVIEELFPSTECWTSKAYWVSESPCQEQFTYLSGLIAIICMVVLGLFSINRMRRWNYTLFYKVHVVLGPLGLLFTVMHYSRMLLYLSPTLLYYLAGNVPVLLEMVLHWRRGGVALSTVTDLPSSSERNLVAFTFQLEKESVAAYRTGMTVKLSCLSISSLSHPFTVNLIKTESGLVDGLIIFRATGSFTRALAKRLLAEMQKPRVEETMQPTVASPAPVILMDGFYGNHKMLQDVYRQNSVLIVAGGVGITPYLSLLSELMNSPRNHELKVHFHWICREKGLIEFVKDKYLSQFELIEGDDTNDLQFTHGADADDNTDDQGRIRITIHPTSQEETLQPEPNTTHHFVSSTGRPLLAHSAARHKIGVLNNLPYVVVFSSIAWSGLFILWNSYLSMKASGETAIGRSYGLLLLLPSSFIIGLVTLFFTQMIKSALGYRHYSSLSLSEKEEGDGISLPEVNGKQSLVVEKSSDYSSMKPRPSPLTCPQCRWRCRPCARSLVVDFLWKTSSPASSKKAVFVCGPKQLVRDVRDAVAEYSYTLPVYEESFRM